MGSENYFLKMAAIILGHSLMASLTVKVGISSAEVATTKVRFGTTLRRGREPL